MTSDLQKIIVYTDGGARGNPGPAGIGVLVLNTDNSVLKEIKIAIGEQTNNYAEYKAVEEALRFLKQHFGKKTKELIIEMRLDSELVERQLNHQYQIKDDNLIPLFVSVHNLRVANFPHLSFIHIPRDQNKEADRLANEAIDEA